MDLEAELIVTLEDIDSLRQINKEQSEEINAKKDQISKLKYEVASQIKGCITQINLKS